MTLNDLPTEEEIFRKWGSDCPTPVVSIICLTFNHEVFVEDALRSFLFQKTSFRFELLIHDDASTDETRKILERYKANYPRLIKLVLQDENQYSRVGFVMLRYLLQMAKGRYIAICDGDDHWADELKLERQVGFLEENLEYVITYTDCIPFSEDGALDTRSSGALRDLSADELVRGSALNTLTVCFRNVINDIPRDLIGAGLGDIVLWSLLGAHGKGKFLCNIKPSCY